MRLRKKGGCMNISHSKIQHIIVLFLPLILLLGGCATLAAAQPRSTTQIDWVNFVRFQGITYLAALPQTGRALEMQDLGPVFAQVQSKLSGNVTDPSYRTKDGDAAFLDAGTKVYTMKGYLPTFRLAASLGQRLQLFEADTNSHARTGADLLDIRGKVQSMTINKDEGDATTVLASLKDAQQVNQLVEMLLSSPVNQQQSAIDGARYFLVFHLVDKTAVVRVYWLDANQLQRGIHLPSAFQEIIKQAAHP
jgi:hypothetical protein